MWKKKIEWKYNLPFYHYIPPLQRGQGVFQVGKWEDEHLAPSTLKATLDNNISMQWKRKAVNFLISWSIHRHAVRLRRHTYNIYICNIYVYMSNNCCSAFNFKVAKRIQNRISTYLKVKNFLSFSKLSL